MISYSTHMATVVVTRATIDTVELCVVTKTTLNCTYRLLRTITRE